MKNRKQVVGSGAAEVAVHLAMGHVRYAPIAIELGASDLTPAQRGAFFREVEETCLAPGWADKMAAVAARYGLRGGGVNTYTVEEAEE